MTDSSANCRCSWLRLSRAEDWTLSIPRADFLLWHVSTSGHFGRRCKSSDYRLFWIYCNCGLTLGLAFWLRYKEIGLKYEHIEPQLLGVFTWLEIIDLPPMRSQKVPSTQTSSGLWYGEKKNSKMSLLWNVKSVFKRRQRRQLQKF